MIVGHLPAGYLLATALDRSFDADPLIWWSIVVGSVLPDVDMLWFYLVDGGVMHHHSYLTHDPTLWLCLLLAGFVLSSRLLIGIGVGAVLHMALDTIVGPISWGFGALSFSGPIVEVPATQPHWVLSFLLHWTFLAELLLWAIATTVFLRRKPQAE